MTPLEKCVSLRTAKKLKEAGWEQWNTNCVWVDWEGWHLESNFAEDYPDYGAYDEGNVFDAPDAQEIGEYLPMVVKDNWYLEIAHDSDGWLVVYRSDEGRDVSPTFRHDAVVSSKDNEAEARALCWLWLKENNLL